MANQKGEWTGMDGSEKKGRLLLTSSQFIRIPKGMVKWKLPMLYMVEDVQRDGDKVVIVLKIVAEGVGHE
jgi:hypothetical protein